jgi:hypothetical protein
VVILEVEPGAIDARRLTKAQADAAAGVWAETKARRPEAFDHRSDASATRLEARIARTRSSTGVPRNRAVPARDAVLAGGRIDHADTSQVEHRARVIVLEAREPSLQLLDSRELELSEQGDAGGLALVGDVKLERHFD